MLEGDLKGEDIRLFVGIPMYGGMVSKYTFEGMLELQDWCRSNGVAIKVTALANESLVSRARNTIVSLFLDDEQFDGTHLLFLDADIGFRSNNIERLIRKNEGVVCGVYPMKVIRWDKVAELAANRPDINPHTLRAKSLDYIVSFPDSSQVKLENGFCRVEDVGAGVMLIRRDVFDTMKNRYPERKYRTEKVIDGEIYRSDNGYDFFAVGKTSDDPDGLYLTEDFYFSYLWRSCGGDIWADVSQPLIHYGSIPFSGHAGALFVADDS